LVSMWCQRPFFKALGRPWVFRGNLHFYSLFQFFLFII
jgi:hypothetical protein